jgi:hypothetical protein
MNAFAAGSASFAATGDPSSTASAGSGSNAVSRSQGSSTSAGALESESAGGDNAACSTTASNHGGCTRAR